MPRRVVTLTVSEDTSLARLTNRRLDPHSGDEYHLQSNPPSKETATSLVQRPLDREESVRMLLECYAASRQHISEFFQQDGAYSEVSGERSQQEVFDAIDHFISTAR